MTSSGFGVGRIRWNWFTAFAVIFVLLPLVSETNTPTLLAIWALFALSLGLMWGYAGILSFGHAAYFGLGAYTYAIASFNIGESTVPMLLAILIPMIVGAIVGAMMFYGRISDVYLGVMTLVVTLILNRFMNATAGLPTGSETPGLGASTAFRRFRSSMSRVTRMHRSMAPPTTMW